MFGEVAEQYDAARPSYPDEIFDIGDRVRRDWPRATRALEIGAGTGKATEKFVARGLHVHALEPSPGMASVLRGKGVDVEESTFEEYDGVGRLRARVRRAGVALGVRRATGTRRLARALQPGGSSRCSGTTAVRTRNRSRPTTTPCTRACGPRTTSTSAELAAEPDSTNSPRAVCSTAVESHVRHVGDRRTRARSGCDCSQTHSDHRMLPDDVRTQAARRRRAAIDKHGGVVAVHLRHRPVPRRVARARERSDDARSVGDAERDRGVDPGGAARRRGGREQRADERADHEAADRRPTGPGSRVARRTRRSG